MVLTVLAIIGSVAFALSGALVAIEEEYDVFGILVLGFLTAFAGGTIRNLIVGLPIAMVWHQNAAFTAAFVAMFFAIVSPVSMIKYGAKPILLLDALGLSTFAVQGALYAEHIHASIETVMVAAVMTGIGGGVIRDVLAQRKPVVLRSDTYAIWALLAGGVVGLRWINPASDWQIYTLILIIFVLRFLSIIYKWRLPHARQGTKEVHTGKDDLR
ncbi:trimeric intracellular cation channel family protein [Alicyclobacillus mengziensis]|uniref:Trimeric intracellular cation channel family protein n=1 Tax=Alicyclobacillus mengziensis TaxID=2931921 RepID=A0A9X7VX31_9BACL|nr:trimeric intracellular cation channel family protein [Alicyclobacillus mengziensis]QSO46614.1 trimeric intracellular cation channel family protein [Alicyclobacillus mengziensis]